MLLLTILAASASEISVDRPSVGASAGTVGAGVFQIETGLQANIEQGAALSLPTLLRYGIADPLELRLDSSVLTLDTGAVSVGGLAPAAKYTLSSTETRTLGVLAGAGLPLGDDALAPYALFLADISSLSVNVGWGGSSALVYAVGYGVSLPMASWSAFAETAGAVDVTTGTWNGTIQSGAVWISGNLEADVYLQTSLNGFNAHTVAVGLSRRFGAD